MDTRLIAVCFISTMLYYGRVAMGQVTQVGCTSALMSLSPCLSYISGTSTTPGNSCCTQLEIVVKTQASCLCQVLSSNITSSFGASINQTQALLLPGACKVETPPVSQCNSVKQTTVGSPVGEPTSSPADDAESPGSSVSTNTPRTPAVSSIPSAGTGSGSKTTTGKTSAGNKNNLPMELTLLHVLLTSISSYIITM